MNTKFFATAIFAAMLVPSIASAASTVYFDPSAGTNSPEFVRSFPDAGNANAAAAKADADRYAVAEQALKSGSSNVLIGTHGSTGVAGAKLVNYYDPGAGNNDPQFATKVVIENPANAAAAKADAERFAEVNQAATSGTLIGTHGSTGMSGVSAFTYYDPAAHDNDPQFSALPILAK